MNYRRMGRTGLRISEISFGAWVTFGDQIDEKIASELVHVAYDGGINYFDNADIYAHGKAEEVMGRAISAISGSAAPGAFENMGAARAAPHCVRAKVWISSSST